MDAVKETVVTSWSALNKALEKPFQAYQKQRWPPRNYLYRGQEPDKGGKKWGLKSSFHRIVLKRLDTEEAHRWEHYATQQFKDAAPLFFHGENLVLPQDIAPSPGWWTLMQHYGAPTRLLDWTSSPYMGVYFAVRDLRKADGELWFFDRQKVIAAMKETHGDQDPNEIFKTTNFAQPPPDRQTPNVWAIFSFQSFPRLQAQQGMFTICDHLRKDHDVAIRQLAKAARMENPLKKIRIAKEAKPEILDRLRQLNITARTLFPGPDGLGRSIREQSHLDMARSVTQPKRGKRTRRTP